MTLEQASAEAGQRIEALDLVPRVLAWTEKRQVRAPIFRALVSGVLSARPPSDIVHELMTGPLEVGI
jgi:glycerol-3-phosphate dehydrogenase